MSVYKCHSCAVEHSTDNMVTYCASCYSSLEALKDMLEAERGDYDDKDALKVAGWQIKALMDTVQRLEKELEEKQKKRTERRLR